MYLSRPAEYALRAMAYLVRLDAQKRVRTRDLAVATGIPAPFLAKILRRLTAVGVLDSQKGHHGGFRLAKPPGEVRFVDILRAVDFEPASDHCIFGWESCGEENPCPLHPEWKTVRATIEEWAETRTLADVLRNNSAVAS